MQYFPDGRSLVQCVGGKRFKVLSRGQRDGYNTAKVQFLSDNEPQGQELEGRLKQLCNSCKGRGGWGSLLRPLSHCTVILLISPMNKKI